MVAAKKKVVVIEGDHIVRENYQLIIDSSSQFQIAGAFTRVDSYHWLQNIKPDIILMDVVQRADSVETIQLIKRELPHAELLIVGINEDSELVFEALKNGAIGYISKLSSSTDLLSILDENSRGEAFMNTKIAGRVIRELDVNNRAVIGKKEAEVLTLLANGNTQSQIAEKLVIPRREVKLRIRQIYRILHAACSCEY